MDVRTWQQEGGAFPHWTSGGLWEASAYQWGWTLTAGWKQKSLPGPPVNLSLAKTEPRKERVQDTTIISFLEMSPDFLVRLPQTQ